MNDHRLCVCLLGGCLRPPTKSANLNTQNVGQKIVSPLSAGPILKPKSVLCVPTGQFGKRTRPLQEDPPTSWLLHLRSKLATKLNTQSTPTKIDNLSPTAHAHTSAVPCRRVCDRLTTAKLASCTAPADFCIRKKIGMSEMAITGR